MNRRFLFCFALIISVIFLFCSCNKNFPGLEGVNDNQTNETITEEYKSSAETSSQPNEIKLTTDKSQEQDSGGAIIEQQKYRVRYYNIPGPFADLVGREVCYEWETEYVKTHDLYSSDKMLILEFIKHFNISKENFEKANLELAKNFGEHHKTMMNPLDHTNQEIYEVFNPDIIYTFDDKIINEYYLSHDYPFLYEHEYEEAVENGTYETRTTDWVDIEQMEAEIIAKYGETEIVTEIAETTTTEAAE